MCSKHPNWNFRNLLENGKRPILHLKEKYPESEQAQNFDFCSSCCEIKRCEESKRTLKNQFASRLAEFDTTLKLLRITDQWYIVPLKFRFGRNRDFLALLSLPLAGGPREGKRFNASSFHTSSDNRERNTQKWNSNNKFKDYVRKKPLRHGCGWQMLRNMLREAQCFPTRRCKDLSATSMSQWFFLT